MGDALPPELDFRPWPPLGRDMPCPNCDHASHSPFPCGLPVVADEGTALCPCRFVPIPGSI